MRLNDEKLTIRLRKGKPPTVFVDERLVFELPECVDDCKKEPVPSTLNPIGAMVLIINLSEPRLQELLDAINFIPDNDDEPW